ncbi:MAG: glutathione-disulfide reductase [Eubacteriaceae bacterium]|nr:glutathione-disulfide reductase [Eubacteriaceae bacterium]
MLKYDYITIGGGSGGLASANRAAERGAKALIIEKDQLGGTCVNRGCVSKKIMWYGAQIAEAYRTYGPDYGFTSDNTWFQYKKLIQSRDAYIHRVHQAYRKGFETRGTEMITGKARFVEPHVLEVEGKKYTAEHITIATGGRPEIPNFEGAGLADTTDTFFKWKELPKSVIVLGGGYIAVEIAMLLKALGVETHFCVRRHAPLRSFEPFIIEGLLHEIEKLGIHFHPHHVPDKIEKRYDGTYRVGFENGENLIAEKVILAVGRKPNTEDIGLETIGVACDDKGYVVVDDHYRTSVSGVYAIGDIIPSVELTPVAVASGRRLADYLFNDQPLTPIDQEKVATVVFSHPPIGAVGLTSEQAIERFGKDKVRIYRSTFGSMYTATTQHRVETRMLLVCVGEKEQVVGIHAIGDGVDEMMQGFSVALNLGATKKDLDNTIAIHPTGAEELVTMR